MKAFISAIQFLTVLPIGAPGAFEPRKMAAFFPMTGLGIGILLFLVDLVARQIWLLPTVAVLDVLFLVIITGALHLDGLGDTADGLYGRRPRENALAIMKDSHMGAMGVVAIICVTALKWAGMAELSTDRGLILILIPAYSRSSILFGFRFLDYCRSAEGTGHPFFDRGLTLNDFWGLMVVAGLSLLLGIAGVVINLVFLLSVISILRFYKKRLGCITGDMLGAMTEVMEAVLFLTAAAL